MSASPFLRLFGLHFDKDVVLNLMFWGPLKRISSCLPGFVCPMFVSRFVCPMFVAQFIVRLKDLLFKQPFKQSQSSDFAFSSSFLIGCNRDSRSLSGPPTSPSEEGLRFSTQHGPNFPHILGLDSNSILFNHRFTVLGSCFFSFVSFLGSVHFYWGSAKKTGSAFSKPMPRVEMDRSFQDPDPFPWAV